MVIAYHLIWTLYGWWLPNDPRGSMSHLIRVERIAELGEPHYGRKLVQPLPAVLREFYRRARETLKHDLRMLVDADIGVVAESIGTVIRESRYTCYACAIMPDHVHMLVRRHREKSEKMIEHFQAKSRAALIDTGRWPSEHPVWGGPGWKVFLNTRADIDRVIKYIRANPVKIGRPAQEWPFVTLYDGWLPKPARET